MRSTETIELMKAIDIILSASSDATPEERVRLEGFRVQTALLAVSQVLSDAADLHSR